MYEFDKAYTFRTNSKLMALVKNRAKKLKLSVSAYIRKCLLDAME